MIYVKLIFVAALVKYVKSLVLYYNVLFNIYWEFFSLMLGRCLVFRVFVEFAGALSSLLGNSQ